MLLGIMILLLIIGAQSNTNILSGQKTERFILVIPNHQFTNGSSDDPVRYYDAALTDSYDKEIELALNDLRSRGIQLNLLAKLTHVLHGAVIETTAYDAEVIRKSLPSYLRIYDDMALEIQLDKSGRWVGVDEVRRLNRSLGKQITGKGILIALLDTGVDYTHPDLKGKVVGGYDFIDNDDDPRDAEGHGTLVAGILVADGILTGIAPEAKLLAYRVVSPDGYVMISNLVRGLEAAVKGGAKIVNLSVGTRTRSTLLDEALRNVFNAGVLAVSAAGNSGPADRTIANPGSSPLSLTVGSTMNNSTANLVGDLYVGRSVHYTSSRLLTLNTTAGSPGITKGRLADVKFARKVDVENLNLNGAIAIAERGGAPGELVYFSEKEKNVASRGALALIIYNNAAGPFRGRLGGSHNPSEYKPDIPVFSVSREDGLALIDAIRNGGNNATLQLYIKADDLASFSSRGPASPFYIKPDILAPGADINSTFVNGRYLSVSGTSFASPHVAGAAALLLQMHPSLSPADIAGILVASAKVLTDQSGRPIPLSQQGSGRLDIAAAAKSPIAMRPHQLVFHLASKQLVMERSIKIINLEDQQITVELSKAWPFQNVASIEIDSSRVILKPGESRSVNVQALLRADTPGEFEGRLVLGITGRGLNLSLPLQVNVNPASLRISKEDNAFSVVALAEDQISLVKLRVRTPFGFDRSYESSRPSDPIAIETPFSGEYWAEAELTTSSGKKFARTFFSSEETYRELPGLTNVAVNRLANMTFNNAFLVVAIAAISLFLAARGYKRKFRNIANKENLPDDSI